MLGPLCECAISRRSSDVLCTVAHLFRGNQSGDIECSCRMGACDLFNTVHQSGQMQSGYILRSTGPLTGHRRPCRVGRARMHMRTQGPGQVRLVSKPAFPPRILFCPCPSNLVHIHLHRKQSVARLHPGGTFSCDIASSQTHAVILILTRLCCI